MKNRLSYLTAVLVASSCLVYAAVHTDYDHKANFSRYHTYSWIGVNAGDSLWHNRITGAVDMALAARGWTKVESGGDAAVSAFGRVEEHDTLETFYTGYPGWGWRARWWGMGTETTEVIPERVGNLTVDIFDGSTKQLLFRGQASDSVSKNADKNDKRLEHSVEEMFKKFPKREKD